MLRPTTYLLIVSLILFSCKGPDHASLTSAGTAEPGPAAGLTADPVTAPPALEVLAEEPAPTGVKVQHSFDTLHMAFDMSGRHYEVVYKDSGEEQLYFFDSRSRDRMIFPDTCRVFQFALSPDGNTLYYTVRDGESLVLKRAMLDGKKALISGIRRFEIPFSDFISGWTGKGSRIRVHGDTLSMGHGTPNEHYGFSSTIHIVADRDSSYLIPSLPLHYAEERVRDYDAHIAMVSEKLKLARKGEHKELFLLSNPDTIQLSDIDSVFQEHYADREYDMEADDMFDRTLFETVEFSPDGSRVLYSYPCVMHDFVHGPMYLVQTGGAYRKLLSIDGGFNRDQRPAWLSGENKLVFHRNSKDDASGLFMTINAENDFVRIAENVNQFEIR